MVIVIVSIASGTDEAAVSAAVTTALAGTDVALIVPGAGARHLHDLLTAHPDADRLTPGQVTVCHGNVPERVAEWMRDVRSEAIRRDLTGPPCIDDRPQD